MAKEHSLWDHQSLVWIPKLSLTAREILLQVPFFLRACLLVYKRVVTTVDILQHQVSIK